MHDFFTKKNRATSLGLMGMGVLVLICILLGAFLHGLGWGLSLGKREVICKFEWPGEIEERVLKLNNKR